MDKKLVEQLKKIRHIALDMDGTIYCGSTLFPFTPKALELFGKLGIGHTFLTNNSSRSVDSYIEKLKGMGLTADIDNMFTSTMATLDYLQVKYPNAKKLFVFGTESLRKEFEQAGFTVIRENDIAEPELVIVGFDTALTYERLCKAAWWMKQGKPFIATHPDWVCPTDQPTVLVDCGSVCAALTAATGVKPEAVLGKPDPCMLTGILKRHNLQPNELAMVGDRIYTDMTMAERAGALGVLVLSGEATLKDVETGRINVPLVVENILKLAELLQTIL
ncbi:MAG: HAD-IIA family hydrolase [Planctomycetaceae bacterium]|nr:HAD-IIA family hydrolase [Planctomycetaceae bacterium]